MFSDGVQTDTIPSRDSIRMFSDGVQTDTIPSQDSIRMFSMFKRILSRLRIASVKFFRSDLCV